MCYVMTIVMISIFIGLSARITIVKPKVKPPNLAGKIFNRGLN